MTIRIEFSGETREDIVFQIADFLKLPAETLTTVLAGEPAAAAPAKGKAAAAAKAATAAAAINGTGGVLDDDKPSAKAAAAKESSLLDDDDAAPVPEEKPVTLDVLKRALVAHINKHTEKVTLALMKKIGKADKISKLDPKYYNVVYQAVSAEL